MSDFQGLEDEIKGWTINLKQEGLADKILDVIKAAEKTGEALFPSSDLAKALQAAKEEL